MNNRIPTPKTFFLPFHKRIIIIIAQMNNKIWPRHTFLYWYLPCCFVSQWPSVNLPFVMYMYQDPNVFDQNRHLTSCKRNVNMNTYLFSKPGTKTICTLVYFLPSYRLRQTVKTNNYLDVTSTVCFSVLHCLAAWLQAGVHFVWIQDNTFVMNQV